MAKKKQPHPIEPAPPKGKPSSIVTYVHHYKRPPRKKPEAASLAVGAIVTPKSPKELKLMRQERWREEPATPDDPEAVARVRAFIKRMTQPPSR